MIITQSLTVETGQSCTCVPRTECVYSNDFSSDQMRYEYETLWFMTRQTIPVNLRPHTECHTTRGETNRLV